MSGIGQTIGLILYAVKSCSEGVKSDEQEPKIEHVFSDTVPAVFAKTNGSKENLNYDRGKLRWIAADRIERVEEK